jgi:N-acetylmuramoyl-L-alanine amidase
MRFSSPHANALSLGMLAVVVACAPAAPSTAPSPSSAANAPALPPIPLVTGPLAPRVVYPVANALIQSRDSNFIFGSVGNGNATLTINGIPVRVYPNGAFLGWLPLPPQEAQQYDLVVALGADTARLTRVVRLQPPAPVPDTIASDSAAVASREANDSVRAVTPAVDSSRARTDSVRAKAPTVIAPRTTADTLRAAKPRAVGDTSRATIAPIVAPDTAATYVALGGIANDSLPADTDRVVIVRPTPAGTYKWFLLPGTVVKATGKEGDFVRVQLDSQLDAFVATADATPLPSGTVAPRRVASNAQVVPAADYVDLVIPVNARPAYFVEQRGNALELTLYGVRATTDIIAYRENDPFVRTVEWEQETNDRARYVVHLREQPFGYLVLWEQGRLVFRVRRPPVVDPRHPLRGIVVAVDPGHPPIGATGPTGLWEPQATLWIGQRVERLLNERGATPVMTRTTMDPVELGDRPMIARRANAQALVSIHLNALPDGINPFRAHGTGTYFFRAQSEPLARAVQRHMVARMGLRNLGVYYDNLALTRPTWMPSILCEGAFLMLPDQEAALRTPEFQERYARGIVDGLEEYFRGLGATSR